MAADPLGTVGRLSSSWPVTAFQTRSVYTSRKNGLKTQSRVAAWTEMLFA
jgi:hypothetical protein